MEEEVLDSEVDEPSEEEEWEVDDSLDFPSDTQELEPLPGSRGGSAFGRLSFELQRSSYQERMALLAGIGAGLILLIVAFLLLNPGLPETADPLSPAQAGSTVTDFYAAINRKDFDGAYQHLSTHWRSQLDRSEFEAGFARSYQVSCQLLGVEGTDPDKARVEVMIKVDTGEQIETVRCYYHLVTEENAWKLDQRQLIES